MTTIGYKDLLTVLRIIMVAAAVTLVAVLIKRDVALSGVFEVEHDFSEPSPFFSELAPLARVESGKSGLRIKDEPVYTTLYFPRPFQDVDLTFNFACNSDLFIEAGPKDSPLESYDLKALNHPGLNAIFDSLGQEWLPAGSDGGVGLYQKRSSQYLYASLEQFFSSPSAQQQTGYYQSEWPTPYLPEFKEEDGITLINTPLRGAHDFLLATSLTSFSFTVLYNDVNYEYGADPVSLVLSDWQGNIIQEAFFEDDGQIGELGVTSTTRQAAINTDELAVPAVYRLQIKATPDIFLQEIETTAAYAAAYGRLWLAGGPDYEREFGASRLGSANIYTSAREWTASTTDRESLQEVRMAGQALSISEPLRDFTYSFPGDKSFALDLGYPLVVTKGNLLLRGRGVFALSKDQYFNPYPWLIDHTLEVDNSEITYVYTEYSKPFSSEDGLYSQVLPYDLSRLYAPEKNLKIKIAAPDLSNEDTFSLLSLKARYSSEPVTFANAWEKFTRFWEREIIR